MKSAARARSAFGAGALAAVLASVSVSCGDASARSQGDATSSSPSAVPDASTAAPADPHAACAARIAALTLELEKERDLRLEREREWLRYTQGMARLTELAAAPRFHSDLPADEREARALAASPAPDGAPSADPTTAEFERSVRHAREERSRAVFLALRSLFAVEHVSGLDLLESGAVANGATGPVVMRVLDERGRPLGSLYAERLRLEGSHTAQTLTLVLEHGFERRAGAKTPFDGGPADEEGRGGVRRIELPHVDPAPWFEGLRELFREDQREAVTQGDPRALNALRFEMNQLFKADASGPVYRLESVMAREGVVLREVHLGVLTPELSRERELFADRMSVLRAERGLEIVLESGSQVRGSEKVPFLEGRYRIFLPRADAARWEAAGIPVGSARKLETPPAVVPPTAAPTSPGG